jgi:hypothetical protein
VAGGGVISAGGSGGGAIGAVIVGCGAALGAAFFLGLALFFLVIRLAFFLAPFLTLRFLAKQSHRSIVEARVVINVA